MLSVALPEPYYGTYPLPETSLFPTSKDALGADFSQVLFSAAALRNGDSAYKPSNPVYRDPFNRLPNYPPLTNFLYIPLTYFDYNKALLIHNFGTLLLFILTTIFMMVYFKLGQYLFKVLLLYVLLYFYTPLGFAHFERGQFDLFLASAYLLIFFSVFDDSIMRKRFALISGFWGALKWSSLPFLGTFCVAAFIGNYGKKCWYFILPLVVIVSSILIFIPQFLEYMPSLQAYEFNATLPEGVTFVKLMPKSVAKSVQISSMLLLIVIFSLFTPKQHKINLFKELSFPFAMAMFIQGMCYGTISYEYRIVSVLGLIPAFILWHEKTNVSSKVKMTTAVVFAAYIIIAFRVFRFALFSHSDTMSYFYFGSSLFCLGLTIYLILEHKYSQIFPD